MKVVWEAEKILQLGRGKSGYSAQEMVPRTSLTKEQGKVISGKMDRRAHHQEPDVEYEG